MYNNLTFLGKARRVTIMLLTLLSFILQSQQVMADDDLPRIDDPSYYTIENYGGGSVHIKMPLYNKTGTDRWVSEGTLTIAEKKSNGTYTTSEIVMKTKIVDDDDISGSATTVEYQFLSEVDGFVELVSERVHVPLNSSWKNVNISFNGDNICFAEFDWYVPVNYRGKNVRFRWSISRNTTDESVGGFTQKVDMEIPEKSDLMDPILTTAIISGDAKYKGMILIPWMISVNDTLVETVKYGYIDENRQRHEESMAPHASGNIVLDATGIYDSLYVKVDYWSWDEQKKGKSLAQNRRSDYYNVPTLHAPLDLTTTPVYGSLVPTVSLDWRVDFPDREDLFDPDNFQMQRSLSGEDDDFRDIDIELYSVGDTAFSIKDSTLLDALKKTDFDANGKLNPVYRVRRTASSLWGWNENPIATTDTLRNIEMYLLTPTGAYGDLIDNDRHVLKVEWDYLQSDNIMFVWDERAEMKLLVKMRRVDGSLADSLVYILSKEEILKKTKEITLPRSCVNYDLFLITSPKTSPLVPYQTKMSISSMDDWKAFAQKVKEGETIYAVLNTDLELSNEVTQIVGYDSNHPFSGIIDGNGHKLILKQMRMAPFRYTKNAVFRNVWLTGEVEFPNSTGGFVHEGENIVFQNCRADYSFPSHERSYFGGFVYLGSHLRFINCLFAGNIANSHMNASGYVYKTDNPTDNKDVVYSNCVFAPAHPYIGGMPSGGLSGSVAMDKSRMKTFYVLTKETDELPYNQIFNVLPPTLQGQLGVLRSQWQAVEEWPGFAPVCVSVDMSDNRVETLVSTESLYFSPNGRVVPNSLVAETRQSSVMLTWEIEGGAVDYFEVLRRPVGRDEWDIVKTDINDLGYEDTTVSPVVDYEYMVRSATDCEGLVFNESDIVPGACLHTGKLEGYIRYADGTGVPGVKVMIVGGNVETFATTDDSGHYEKDLLGYQGQLVMTYRVTPAQGESGITLEEGKGSSEVEFNERSNYTMLEDFIVISGYKFNGKVLYSGTTIPVPGVHFMVNGHHVYTPSGKELETDSEGKFNFYVNGGNNKIQAVLDGHNFKQDGWFKGEEGHQYGIDFHDDMNSIIFYDETRVKLIGRVAGGRDQLALPLDNSLSHNNLGDTIVIVMALEGDNKSRLVYDNLDPLKEKVDTVFVHKTHDQYTYQTMMSTTRRNIKIWPDPKTGEYTVMLPPVKWKIQQVYATGYPTLFKEGKVGDVIDLTDSLTLHKEVVEGLFNTYGGNEANNVTVEYNAIYNCIWNAPVELTYKQLGFNNFGFFGDQYYSARNIDGSNATVPLAYKVNNAGSDVSTKVKYTFGHPVFSIERQYPFQLSAVERYYWNNNHNSDTVDVVHMHGGKVSIHNGMVSSAHQMEVDLDENGEATVPITAVQVPYLLTKEDALRTITMSLTLDGTSYEAEPLNAYVLNVYALPGAPDIMSVGHPILVDILRDPPGGFSKATLNKGSTLKYSYSMEMEWKLGVGMKFSEGTKLSNFTGMVALPTTAGIINQAESEWETSLDLIANGKGKRAFSYTIKAANDISTSTDPKLVGAPADVFIGIQQSVVAKPSTAIRAIPDAFYVQMGGELAAGRAVEIARGYDQNGELFHLIRDESVATGPQFESTFAHTQRHIIETTLPGIMNQCKSLMFTGTRKEAQNLANKKQIPVYWSLVSPDDEDRFAIMNTIEKVNSDGEVEHEYVLYTSESSDLQGMNYRIILPKDYDTSMLRDSVYQLNQTFLTWVEMLAQNEKDKLSATELVKNFDVDGGVGMNYEEEFETNYGYEYSLYIPFFTDMHDNFFASGFGGVAAGFFISQALGVTPMLLKYFESLGKLTKSKGEVNSTVTGTSVSFAGSLIKVEFEPAISMDNMPSFGKERTWSRKESFEISMNQKNHLNFDVYRAKSVAVEDVADDEMDVFTSEEFYNNVDGNNEYIDRFFSTGGFKQSRSFVYRTRGGATCRPYEGERSTVFYKTGEILDQRTKQIEKPVIRLDKQSISGVPYGEPARFQLYLSNESEAPESAYPALNLYLDDKSNPNGAILKVDGIPLNWNGFSIGVEPGKVTQKTLEVYASNGFDYEDITVGLMSEEDNTVADEVSFDVHFLRTAGNVNISSPGDKWVMNTDAPHDKRGYHIPVTIDGFDKNQHNFDHIEFQYKESDRGDDFWTNICSFYANDSLYQMASGTKEMIPQNGNITTDFYGELEVMEKAYDLRAVLFCRNGNDFITSSSKVLSGVKDTRRPQLFGTPEPSDGILDVGDNIVFNFSEAIEHNYLDDLVNFEVKGEVNNDDITRQISLLFSGNGGAISEARRNFANKDITVELMIKPDDTGQEMPIFSHGTSDNKLQLWITADKHLKAVVGKNRRPFVSDSTINIRDFRHVAMVIKQPENLEENNKCQLKFYNDETCIGSFNMDYAYTGVGPLIFGASNEAIVQKRKYYKGKMLEARLWYRALTGDLIGSTYGNKRLSGYEMGLADYYPMNDGRGDHASDQAQGAHLSLGEGVEWTQPEGMSLHLEWEDRGMALNKNAINRGDEYDYTLMFWFKTAQQGRGVLISNGSGDADELGAKNRFYIGLDSDKLMFRSNGRSIEVPGYYSDNKWHHYAMTVNRSRNVGNIYVDQTLRNTFSVDTLGGISGGNPMLGAALKSKIVNGNAVLEDTRNWLRGDLDEICLFAQALPSTLIEAYSTRSPKGDEAGLISYMGFSRQERQEDNDIVLQPYAYSQRIYKDHGKIVYETDSETGLPTTTPKRDYLFADSIPVQTVLNHINTNMGAPVVPNEDLHNLDFSYVGKDNQLLVNINEIDSKINKRNVYVTVRSIPDANGNEMASPATACFYVDRNPLRWGQKSLDLTMYDAFTYTVDVNIINNGATTHTYKVEGCPKWLTVTPSTNLIGPRGEAKLTLKFNPNMNVGSYDEIIYLTDEDGLSEPLPVYVTILGNSNSYWVDPYIKKYSMNFAGRVMVNDAIDTDIRDIVGVFDEQDVCHGVSNIDYNEETGESYVFLTIYNETLDHTPFYFKLWHESTGKEMLLTPENGENYYFVSHSVIGKDDPVILVASNQYVQYFDLEPGWNWISTNVYNDDMRKNFEKLLNAVEWSDGDAFTDNNENLSMVYSNGRWLLSDSLSKFTLEPQHSYCVKVDQHHKFHLMGSIIDQEYQRTIHLEEGWNPIGYTPMVNLPVGTALADYRDWAQDGDVIKSHDEFAVLHITAQNSYRWNGNLKYMRPGKGYMLLHQSKEACDFTYPFFEPGSIFFDETMNAPERKVNSDKMSTMSLSAVAAGVELEEGDKLLAYADGELCGEATIIDDDGIFYMSIGGDREQPIWFAIEREGDIIASTSEVLKYETNAVIGTPQNPTRIDFTRRDLPKYGWYTLEGIKLPARPTKKGVYILNGKKIVVD